MATSDLTLTQGTPYPLGLSFNGNGTNFAVASSPSKELTLCLFTPGSPQPIHEIPLPAETHKTGDVWHICIANLDPDLLYAYKTTSTEGASPLYLLDPYAKEIATSNEWRGNKKAHELQPYRPLGRISPPVPFDWENDTPPNIPANELIIYEMHVRGFTKHPSSQTKHPGTFLGVIEKIPYLLDLGVNAVELLPVHEFDEAEYVRTHPNFKPLSNFWGYSTINFFSPMNRYAVSTKRGDAINEFKTMVRELHKNRIEVILDVVFNHTGEGDKFGPVYSFKGLDNSAYYMLDENGGYSNYSGCGNSFNANYLVALELIIDSLRYWVAEMHVDGFRFDLASALTRRPDGQPIDPAPLIQAITSDPVLSKVKLIAEPWDAAGLYQVGKFAPETPRWAEWNGKYRDCMRKFIKGMPWMSGEFATRICGSQDLYHARGPCNSINFVTCHDGFSLADLVSYNNKHNLSNGENNQDGSGDNESWNCGIEGPTNNQKITALRERQMKNYHLALMISQGIPMLNMGDEYGHTKSGNNNTWCQDNELNWFLWDQLHNNAAMYRFFKLMIKFRKDHPFLSRTTFLTGHDVDWHGIQANQPEWNSNIPLVAFTLKSKGNDRDLYIAFNAQNHAQTIELPNPPYSKKWRWVVNTANPSPEDIYANNDGPLQLDMHYKMAAFSAIVLTATR